MGERLEESYRFLDTIEPDLRSLIAEKQIGTRLLDEKTPVGINPPYRPIFHQGGEETYGFERNRDDWPSRSIRWQGENRDYYLIQIFSSSSEDPQLFTLWTVASSLPFGQEEGHLFDKSVIVTFQEQRPFRDLLEERFNVLTSTVPTPKKVK